MNNKVKSIIIFVGGMLTGGGVGVLATRGYFRKQFAEKADAEIAEMEEYFHKKQQELVDLFNEDEFQEKVEEPAESKKSEEEVKASIKEKLTRNYEQTTNYAKMYRTEEELEEDGLADAVEVDSEEARARAAHEDHQANKNRPPKIISEDALGEIPAYVEHKVLFFYRLDDTITDEEDQVIDDPEYLLGDALDKYNFRESEENIIFVRNFALDTVYEIQKLDSAFEEE